MLVELAKEEVEAMYARADELKASDSMEDKICGLLIDMRVGNTGLHEETARKKASAIWQMVVEWAANKPLSDDLKEFLKSRLEKLAK